MSGRCVVPVARVERRIETHLTPRKDWKKVGDPILHIELRRWADLVVVAPCSADFLAKLAGGLCDNLAVGHPLSSCDPFLMPR
jgi:phosphopantothenoylcysteine synthetase/decarboxylase